MPELQRKRLAVMFTDIAGFTSLMEKNEAEGMKILTRCNDAFMKQLESYSGSLVKVMGDGTLSTFIDPSGAVKCARSFQDSIKDFAFSVRIGIHLGDVIHERNDIYGDTVNVASRLEKLSPPGCICISRETLNECDREHMPDARPLGLHRLRGLGRLIEIYTIAGTRTLPDMGPPETDEIRKPSDNDRVPSLAVIPFDNLGSEQDSFYTFGISADLASDLSRAGRINMASLSDVSRVIDDEPSRDEIASRLGVRYLVMGSLWKEKNKFRISVELSDHFENRIIWVDSWEDDWDFLSSIKGKLADGLLKALGIESGVFPGITDTVTGRTEAYELYLKGRHEYSIRSSKDGLEKAREILKRSIELDEDLIQARVCFGRTYRDHGEYATGSEILREALDIAVMNTDHVGQLDALNEIGIILWKQSRLKEARKAYEKVLSLSESISDRGGQGRVLNNLGLVEWSSGNLGEALSRFEESLLISDELAANTLQSSTLCNIGLVKASLGDDSAALLYYQKALDIHSTPGKLDTQAHILINMGNSHFRNGSLEKARSIFQRSLSIFRKLGDDPGASKCLNNLGNVMLYLGMFEEADAYYSEAREIAKKQADLSMEGIILSGMGLLHLKKGEPGKSLPLLTASLEICRETRDREGEGELLVYLGEAYLNLGRLISADEVLAESLLIMEEIGSKKFLAYTKALLSRLKLISGISKNTALEADAMIESSLLDLEHQNKKDHSEVYRILADSYLLLRDCGFPDLISADKCIEGYRTMISNAYDTLTWITDRIDDTSLRKIFLEAIPAHREIVRKFEQLAEA
ncbi:MAG: tetratricopeptide repeat protein [Candidatus Fermentibacteria bacterium]